MKNDSEYKAKGSFLTRFISILFLLPSWFSPHTKLRVFFHKLRGVNIGKNVEIGYFCILGNVHPKLITIEDNVVITAKVVLLEHDNSYYYTRGLDVKIGPVVLKKFSFIGINTVVLPNVTIGERSIVGPNSVVLKDIPSDVIAGGVPAKILKKM